MAAARLVNDHRAAVDCSVSMTVARAAEQKALPHLSVEMGRSRQGPAPRKGLLLPHRRRRLPRQGGGRQRGCYREELPRFLLLLGRGRRRGPSTDPEAAAADPRCGPIRTGSLALSQHYGPLPGRLGFSATTMI